ncbi:MAG: alpha/beta hydrolase [Deltaproteobacteria bacterium]|nr:alpha/beta hydrolase [Deltaproteobacteria bacterium]
MGPAEASEARGPTPWSFSLMVGEAIDGAILAFMNTASAHPRAGDLDRLAVEISGAHRLYRERGLLGRPDVFHRLPPPLFSPRVGGEGFWPFDYRWLSFPSGYDPDPTDPATSRWSQYQPNHTAHAWVLRHPHSTADWLICLHGMGAGHPALDFPGFRARTLQQMGLNLLFPVLPLHGPRRVPGKGVRAFLSFDLLDALHGFTQAVSEVRRLIRWARGEGAKRVGLYGLSLGAYTAALVATLEEVDLLIAGIPVSDLPDLFLWHAPPQLRAEVAARDLFGPELRDLFALVSPLGRPPLLPRERRFIFAGLGDRMAPAVQARRLWEHWERPSIAWYAGGHVSFFWTSEVQAFVRGALMESGFLSPPGAS